MHFIRVAALFKIATNPPDRVRFYVVKHLTMIGHDWKIYYN